MIYTSDDEFFRDCEFSAGHFSPVDDCGSRMAGPAAWLSGEKMRWMQDTFLSPGAKGRGRFVFGALLPHRQETGTGPVLPQEAAAQPQWRGQKFPIMHGPAHTHTQNTAGCVFINRGTHIHK